MNRREFIQTAAAAVVAAPALPAAAPTLGEALGPEAWTILTNGIRHQQFLGVTLVLTNGDKIIGKFEEKIPIEVGSHIVKVVD